MIFDINTSRDISLQIMLFILTALHLQKKFEVVKVVRFGLAIMSWNMKGFQVIFLINDNLFAKACPPLRNMNVKILQSSWHHGFLVCWDLLKEKRKSQDLWELSVETQFLNAQLQDRMRRSGASLTLRANKEKLRKLSLSVYLLLWPSIPTAKFPDRSADLFKLHESVYLLI